MSYSRHGVTWRYLRGRTVKHALVPDGGYIGHRAAALCGTSSRPADQWHGTGSQNEYEQVERLPECRRCARLLTPPPDTAPAQLPSAPAAESATSPTR